jgi:hypothetical protein
MEARCEVILPLLVSANVFPSSLILFALMTEVICYFETSVLTRATRPQKCENV